MSHPQLIPADTVSLAQQLLEVVKSVAASDQLGVEEKRADVDLLVGKAKTQIQNICFKLLAKTMGPLGYTMQLAVSCQESEALYFVTALNIADLIGDGEESLVSLSEKAGVEPQFLGVVMTCVLGLGYFQEVGQFSSGVYKNNELSQVLRENHPTSLQKLIGLLCDEGLKASSYLLEAARVAPPSEQGIPAEKIPAINLAFGFSGSHYDWRALPENAWRSERVGGALCQFDEMLNSNISEDYPWHNLSSPIVDVGGGMGSLEKLLFKCERHNRLEFIIFDLPATIEIANKIWSTQPSSVSARVSFVGGNFMAPTVSETNLPTGKPTYVIRHVLHNWTDDIVLSILKIVRQAMLPRSRLLLVEMLIQPESSRSVRATSVYLLAMGSGMTRSQAELEGLARKAGFKIVTVTHMRTSDAIIEVALE